MSEKGDISCSSDLKLTNRRTRNRYLTDIHRNGDYKERLNFQISLMVV